MARERYILRNPHDINDEHAVNASVQVIRASDGEQFLGMPLPDVFCIDKTPKPRKSKTDFDNNAAVKAAKAALQRSVAERRIADGNIEMGGTGVEHGGDQRHTRTANASRPKISTPNEWPREENPTDFDGDGNPVLWDEYGGPRLDQEGNRLYRDSTGMIVRKGITYDRKNNPVSPYGEGFIWKQGKTPYKGQSDGGEDGGEKVYVRDMMMQEYAANQKMRLKTAVLPVAAITISRILNHPNIVSLIDIVDNSSRTGEVENSGIYNNITIWEDMTAGCLADLLPSVPAPEHPKWQKLVQYDPHRFSLPESLCWHVLGSVSRALLWLHYGVKETAGITDDFNSHDEDWMPILTRDVNPGNIFFRKPKGKETYGECKLGGFEYAKIASNKKVVLVPTPWNEVENEGVRVATEKKHYWAPEIFSNASTWGRPSEIWSLGAVIFCMMTGIPPPRISDYSWTISRMNDRGYSEGIRNIVAAMLSDKKNARPQANTVVGLVETGIRTWRAQTLDGRKYVDIRDEEIEEATRGGGRSDEPLFI